MSSVSMSGRVCVVTGANSGLGLATSKALGKMGATLVMVCRSRDKGEIARSAIKKSAGRESGIDLLVYDLIIVTVGSRILLRNY